MKAGISIYIQKDVWGHFNIHLWEIVVVEMEVSEKKKAHFFIYSLYLISLFVRTQIQL